MPLNKIPPVIYARAASRDPADCRPFPHALKRATTNSASDGAAQADFVRFRTVATSLRRSRMMAAATVRNKRDLIRRFRIHLRNRVRFPGQVQLFFREGSRGVPLTFLARNRSQRDVAFCLSQRLPAIERSIVLGPTPITSDSAVYATAGCARRGTRGWLERETIFRLAESSRTFSDPCRSCLDCRQHGVSARFASERRIS